MRYFVEITDSAEYTIDAANEEEARMIAEEWFIERKPRVSIKPIPTCVVESERLHDVIEAWVETFNDCACCPCIDCPLTFGESFYECAQRIIDDPLGGEKVR